MEVIFEKYGLEDVIPAKDYLGNKKLAKYFNRETAAAIVCAGKLFNGVKPSPDLPVYYSTGLVEFEDYGLERVVANSRCPEGLFNDYLFINKAMPEISPLTQFKVLYNMPISFISIEYNLTGDNAVLYGSANSLLQQIRYSPCKGLMLAGAGKVYDDGTVESGFALLTKEEASEINCNREEEAVVIFRNLFKTIRRV